MTAQKDHALRPRSVGGHTQPKFPVGGDTHPRQGQDLYPGPHREGSGDDHRNAPPPVGEDSDLGPNHPRRVRVVHRGAVYFVTTVTKGREPLLLRRGMPARLLADLWIALRMKGTECLALALLPDHAHLILQPMGSHSLSDFMHSWKRNGSYNANRLIEGINFRWQESFRDHALRDERDLLAHYRYVLGNPKKHGGVGLAKSYPEGLSKRQELGRLGVGQDLYPGLRKGRIAATDREIDSLVYDLYGLTDEEIRIVEGGP